ncbi:MAG TPA: TIGR04053 family radical SAM/SPASM domain-containing protein [Actinomycetota bacterium]|nr:TIGR04053 family radical SAM/SPASM domain-containing protein [Actinomycetota bacterium]
MGIAAAGFDLAPILLFWETTRACGLACRHCRAEAIAAALPGQLSTAEGLRLIDDLGGFAPRRPVLIFTGGDPFMREDPWELSARARAVGLPIGFAPSVTPRLTEEVARRMREEGARTVSISLDGADPATHEGVRGVAGHFAQTEQAVRMLVREGLSVQINTTVMRSNVEQLADIAGLVASWGARIWEVFFLIRVGRGVGLDELSPQENEDVVHFLFEASRYGFVVRTVEAPFFRRVVAERRALGTGVDPAARFGLGPLHGRLVGRLHALLGPPGESRAQSVGTRDGKGILFVAHDGDVFPAGFLPVRLGNVREDNVVRLYREHPLLGAIRGASFSGRCGRCEFADACGGSRSRAYATAGDPLGEDPACAYLPGPGSGPEARLGRGP